MSREAKLGAQLHVCSISHGQEKFLFLNLRCAFARDLRCHPITALSERILVEIRAALTPLRHLSNLAAPSDEQCHLRLSERLLVEIRAALTPLRHLSNRAAPSKPKR